MEPWSRGRRRVDTACAIRVDEPRRIRVATELRRLPGDRNGPHFSGHPNGLHTHKLGFQLGISIFEQHGDDLSKVGLQLFSGCSLAVRPRPSRNVPNEEIGIGISFDDDAEGPQRFISRGKVLLPILVPRAPLPPAAGQIARCRLTSRMPPSTNAPPMHWARPRFSPRNATASNAVITGCASKLTDTVDAGKCPSAKPIAR